MINKVYLIAFIFFPATIVAQNDMGYNLIQEKCTLCHSNNDIAPYDFSSIESIIKNSKTILFCLKENYMPLWFANSNYRHFYNERVLTENEKFIIINWVENLNEYNNNQIDKRFLQTVINKQDTIKPSFSVSISNTYRFGNLTDQIFLNYKELDHVTTKNIKGATLSFLDKNSVHHAVVYGLDSLSKNYKFVINSDTKNIEGNALGDVTLSVYAPGVNYALLPDGFGFVTGTVKGLLLETHLLVTDEPTPVKATANFYYCKEKTIREVKSLNLTNLNDHSSIEPNTIKTYSGNYQLNDSISLLAIMPHMHKIASRFYSFAITPLQDTIPLLELKKWSFDWQTIYRLDSLLPLPKNTIIYYEATFDNTIDNLANPSNPPKKVWVNIGWSIQNEMLVFGLQYTDYKYNDESLKLNWINISIH